MDFFELLWMLKFFIIMEGKEITQVSHIHFPIPTEGAQTLVTAFSPRKSPGLDPWEYRIINREAVPAT